MNKLINLGLRGISMGAKFLLIVILSKYISEEEIGELGILLTTVTILVFIIGLDFYNYATRELLSANTDSSYLAKTIVNQYLFYFFAYIIFIPVLYFIIPSSIVNTSLVPLFLLLLILEHFSQELYRSLIAIEKQIIANVLLFFRTAFWIVILFFILFVGRINFSLKLLLYLWIGGSSIGAIFGIIVLVSHLKIKQFDIDFKWILKGIKVSIPFLLATLSYKIIEYSDRYMIDFMLGKSQTGIYIFYANMANILNVFVNTVVIILLYPPLLKLFNGNNNNAFLRIRKKFKNETLAYTFGGALLLVAVIYPILAWQEKSNYASEIGVYFVLIASNIALNISFIPHYLLYAKNKDKIIFSTTFAAAIVNVLLNYIGIRLSGIIGAAYATFFSYLLIMILKLFYNKKHRFEIEK